MAGGAENHGAVDEGATAGTDDGNHTRDRTLIRVVTVSLGVQRRAFLKATSTIAAGSAIGLAGCLGAPGGGAEETETPEETEPAEGTETPTETVTETPTETPTEPPTEAATPTETATPGGGQVDTRYRLGARVEAWQGQEPQRIAGTENPTLQLEVGKTYEVTWENLDGVPHDFTIQDAQGNDLAGTEIMSQEGQTLTLTFTASEEMAQYICTVHPNTMVGDVQFGGG